MFIARADRLLEQLGADRAGAARRTRASSPRPGTTPRRADPSSTWSGRSSRRSRSTTRSPSPPPRPGASPSSPATSTGTTSATSPRSRSCTPAAASRDLAILGENARVLADASSGIVVSQSGRAHLADRRARTSSSSTPRTRCSSRRPRTPSGSRRRRRPEALRPRATCSELHRAVNDAPAACAAWRSDALTRRGSHSLAASVAAVVLLSRAARPTAGDGERGIRDYCARMVTNSGGLEDRSFNQSSWAGPAAGRGRVRHRRADALVSTGETDLAPNVEQAVGIRLRVHAHRRLRARRRPPPPRPRRTPTSHFAIVDEVVDAPNVKPDRLRHRAGRLPRRLPRGGRLEDRHRRRPSAAATSRRSPSSWTASSTASPQYNEVHGTARARARLGQGRPRTAPSPATSRTSTRARR